MWLLQRPYTPLTQINFYIMVMYFIIALTAEKFMLTRKAAIFV